MRVFARDILSFIGEFPIRITVLLVLGVAGEIFFSIPQVSIFLRFKELWFASLVNPILMLSALLVFYHFEYNESRNCNQGLLQVLCCIIVLVLSISLLASPAILYMQDQAYAHLEISSRLILRFEMMRIIMRTLLIGIGMPFIVYALRVIQTRRNPAILGTAAAIIWFAFYTWSGYLGNMVNLELLKSKMIPLRYFFYLGNVLCLMIFSLFIGVLFLLGTYSAKLLAKPDSTT